MALLTRRSQSVGKSFGFLSPGIIAWIILIPVTPVEISENY
ncbi:hypothetical protein AAFM79_17240 [Trichormus azollae HNT15244]